MNLQEELAALARAAETNADAAENTADAVGSLGRQVSGAEARIAKLIRDCHAETMREIRKLERDLHNRVVVLEEQLRADGR